jgi:hypothetical protein
MGEGAATVNEDAAPRATAAMIVGTGFIGGFLRIEKSNVWGGYVNRAVGSVAHDAQDAFPEGPDGRALQGRERRPQPNPAHFATGRGLIAPALRLTELEPPFTRRGRSSGPGVWAPVTMPVQLEGISA